MATRDTLGSEGTPTPTAAIALLVGGPADLFRELGNKLWGQKAINLKHHWPSDKPKLAKSALPAGVDLVIALQDIAGHPLIDGARVKAEDAGVPFVRGQRKWATLTTQLDRAGFKDVDRFADWRHRATLVVVGRLVAEEQAELFKQLEATAPVRCYTPGTWDALPADQRSALVMLLTLTDRPAPSGMPARMIVEDWRRRWPDAPAVLATTADVLAGRASRRLGVELISRAKVARAEDAKAAESPAAQLPGKPGKRPRVQFESDPDTGKLVRLVNGVPSCPHDEPLEKGCARCEAKSAADAQKATVTATLPQVCAVPRPGSAYGGHCRQAAGHDTGDNPTPHQDGGFQWWDEPEAAEVPVEVAPEAPPEPADIPGAKLAAAARVETGRMGGKTVAALEPEAEAPEAPEAPGSSPAAELPAWGAGLTCVHGKSITEWCAPCDGAKPPVERLDEPAGEESEEAEEPGFDPTALGAPTIKELAQQIQRLMNVEGITKVTITPRKVGVTREEEL